MPATNVLWFYFWSGGTAPEPEPAPTTSPLGAGLDVTTAVIAWMAGQHFGGDLNTHVRDALATGYSSGENEDLTTLFTRFEDHNKEPGAVYFNPIDYLLGDAGYLLQDDGFKVVL